MSDIIQLTDFKLEYKVPQNDLTEPQQQPIIDKKEKKYLVNMLGSTLYKLFIADLLNGVPQAARFTSIFDAFTEDDGNCIRESLGIKEMLQQMVYGNLIESDAFQNTTVGPKSNNSANAESAGLQDTDIYETFNDGVQTYRTIQWFILDDTTDLYPEYNGQPIKLSTWL